MELSEPSPDETRKVLQESDRIALCLIEYPTLAIIEKYYGGNHQSSERLILRKSEWEAVGKEMGRPRDYKQAK